MEHFIFIREFEREGKSSIPAKSMLRTDVEGFFAYRPGDGRRIPGKIRADAKDLMLHVLKIDNNLFERAFDSFAYMNWLKEMARDVDEHQLPLYPGLTKSRESLILFLREIGLSSSQIMKAMLGPGNTYAEYLAKVQAFGQTIIE